MSANTPKLEQQIREACRVHTICTQAPAPLAPRYLGPFSES